VIPFTRCDPQTLAELFARIKERAEHLRTESMADYCAEPFTAADELDDFADLLKPFITKANTDTKLEPAMKSK
jgi:hypothetical protein